MCGTIATKPFFAVIGAIRLALADTGGVHVKRLTVQVALFNLFCTCLHFYNRLSKMAFLTAAHAAGGWRGGRAQERLLHYWRVR